MKGVDLGPLNVLVVQLVLQVVPVTFEVVAISDYVAWLWISLSLSFFFLS